MSDTRGKREASVDTLTNLLPKLTMGKKDEIPSENYIRQMYTQGRTEYNNKKRIKEAQAIKKTQAKANAAQKEMVREVRDRIAQRSKQRIEKKFGKKLLNKWRLVEDDILPLHTFPPKRKFVFRVRNSTGALLNKKTNSMMLYEYMTHGGLRKQHLPKPHAHVKLSNKNFESLKSRYFSNIVSSLRKQGIPDDQIRSMAQSAKTKKRKNMGSQNLDVLNAFTRGLRQRR